MPKPSFDLRTTSRRAAFLAVAISLAGLTTTPAMAQRIGASAQTVSVFLGNPTELITRSPKGGAEMVANVRDLVTGDAATLKPILSLLSNVNKEQKQAIGAAFAQAAKIVVRTNPSFAAEIQQAILNSRDEDLVLAFAAGAGDAPIGAAGGSGGMGGGAGGGIGGQTSPLVFGSGNSGVQAIGQAGVSTANFSYSSSVAGLGNTPTANAGISAVVSP
jgi:hypothetical protein